MENTITKEWQEQEELRMLEDFEASLEGFESEYTPDPSENFPKKCVCGGTITPIYEDNPHFGSVCDTCDADTASH